METLIVMALAITLIAFLGGVATGMNNWHWATMPAVLAALAVSILAYVFLVIAQADDTGAIGAIYLLLMIFFGPFVWLFLAVVAWLGHGYGTGMRWPG